jgi:hypothetical protein
VPPPATTTLNAVAPTVTSKDASTPDPLRLDPERPVYVAPVGLIVIVWPIYEELADADVPVEVQPSEYHDGLIRFCCIDTLLSLVHALKKLLAFNSKFVVSVL